MKTKILSILLLLCIVLLSSCQIETIHHNTTSTVPKPSTTQVYNTPLYELAKYKFYNFHYRIPARTNGIILASEGLLRIQDYHAKFPIQRIEQLDSETICVIYRMKMDDSVETFVYLIFKKGSSNWKATGEVYFVSRDRCCKDFSSIGVGTPANKVLFVDPAIKYDWIHALRAKKFTAYRLLSDGLLLIDFETASDSYYPDFAEYHVTSLAFYPYGSTDAPDYISVLNYPDILQDN